jgi:allantoinase
VERIAEWMCAAPARQCGWGARKGRIEVGYDADIVVWDPEATFRVGRLFHRHPQTPYAGRELRGVVRQTFVRGELVFDRGEIVSPPGGQ